MKYLKLSLLVFSLPLIGMHDTETLNEIEAQVQSAQYEARLLRDYSTAESRTHLCAKCIAGACTATMVVGGFSLIIWQMQQAELQ